MQKQYRMFLKSCCPAIQEISCLLWNLKVHYVRKSPHNNMKITESKKPHNHTHKTQIQITAFINPVKSKSL
jgi:hypothetical protein